jgi:hypothetical protein
MDDTGTWAWTTMPEPQFRPALLHRPPQAPGRPSVGCATPLPGCAAPSPVSAEIGHPTRRASHGIFPPRRPPNRLRARRLHHRTTAVVRRHQYPCRQRTAALPTVLAPLTYRRWGGAVACRRAVAGCRVVDGHCTQPTAAGHAAWRRPMSCLHVLLRRSPLRLPPNRRRATAPPAEPRHQPLLPPTARSALVAPRRETAAIGW